MGPYPAENHPRVFGFQGPRSAVWMRVSPIRWSMARNIGIAASLPSRTNLTPTSKAPLGILLLFTKLSSNSDQWTFRRICARFSPSVIHPTVAPKSWPALSGPIKANAMLFRSVDLPEAFPPRKTVQPAYTPPGRSSRLLKNAVWGRFSRCVRAATTGEIGGDPRGMRGNRYGFASYFDHSRQTHPVAAKIFGMRTRL